MINGIGSGGMMMRPPDAATVQHTKEQMFQNADSDGNGSIDQAEFSSFAEMMAQKVGHSPDSEEAFSRLDGNGDGALSKAELEAGHERMRHMRSMQGGPPPMSFDSSDNVSDLGSVLMSQLESYASASQFTSKTLLDMLG